MSLEIAKIASNCSWIALCAVMVLTLLMVGVLAISCFIKLPRIKGRDVCEVALYSAVGLIFTTMLCAFIWLIMAVNYEDISMATESTYVEIESITTSLDAEKGIMYTITTADSTTYVLEGTKVTVEEPGSFADTDYAEIASYVYPEETGKTLAGITLYISAE